MKYIVTLEVHGTIDVEVEAANVDEACEIAEFEIGPEQDLNAMNYLNIVAAECIKKK